MTLQFGTDGIRGRANSELTVDLVLNLAKVSAEVLGKEYKFSKFYIGTDTRVSGPMLEAALVAGITSYGLDVELLGVVPTPAVAWHSAQNSQPGIMVSASHNPYWDNGIKIFAPGGLKLTDDVENQIQVLLDEASKSKTINNSGPDVNPGRVTLQSDEGWGNSLIESARESSVDLSEIKVVVDCANGAASIIAPNVLTALGADVITINNEPDGFNINDKCGSTDITDLQSTVVESGSNIGVAFDGDADRLIAVAEDGAKVNGDRLLAILAKSLQEKGQLADDTVVVTVMSNLGFHRAMESFGIKTIITQVGDRYVLEAIEKGNFSLGGEQSGHVICRELATTGDGLLAAIKLIEAVKRTGRTLSDISASIMEDIPQILKNVKLKKILSSSDTEILPTVLKKAADMEMEFSGAGRVLVRPSGTEPLLRIMVEHEDSGIAEQSCSEMVAYVESSL